MKILSENGNIRTIAFATPNIRLEAEYIMLDVFKQVQVQQSPGVWVNAGLPEHLTSLQLSKERKIHPTEFRIDGDNGLPSYDVFLAIIAPVYDQFATAAETLLENIGVFNTQQ